MNDEHWFELTERIRDTFKVTLDVERQIDPSPGRIEELEFDGPEALIEAIRTDVEQARQRLASASRPGNVPATAKPGK